MNTEALLYYFGFVIGVAAIVFISHLVWRHQIDSMPDPPHWAEAERLIWVEQYGMDWNARPRIIFIRGKAFYACQGLLVTGETDGMAVTVAVETDTTPISDTAFAHELWHVALRAKGLNPDKEHISEGWRPNGTVARANALLKARGW